MAIDKALHEVVERINKSAISSGRRPEDIKLVAVSKTIGPEKIVEAVKAGAAILGENRVQEARDKINQIKDLPDVEWHLIGNLQKNKARTAVELFDLIHSVDSISLSEELDKQAHKTGKKQRVLVQVKLSDEETKYGIKEHRLIELLEKISGADNLHFEGLMTIPPFFDDPEQARPYFRKLRKIADQAGKRGFPVKELSMGMTNDFEIAIEEGATMVRIGTAIFGERQY